MARRFGYLNNIEDLRIARSLFYEYFTEETSEYHKYNIDNNPEHKKVMEKFVSISAERHKEFEKNHKAKKHHLLDLNKYISSNSSIENKSDLVDNLKKLND